MKEAGFQVLGAVDIDARSITTYKANHPDVIVWQSDIRELEPTELLDNLELTIGSLDLLTGCPPCQGFSTIRTLNGAVRINDSRNELLLEFQRFVEKIYPRAIMIENVPGLVTSVRFTEFCKRMEELGYIGDYRILNAADYGVPQRRRRLIYIAGLGISIPFAGKIPGIKTVRDAIGDLPKAGESGDPIHDIPENRTPKVKTIIKNIPKNGGSREVLPQYLRLECHKKCSGFKDVYGRMAWDKVAPTITSGCFNPSKGRFLHPDENRAITMREAALLQGFPTNYEFPNIESKTGMALMIGNALPPPFIAAHARCILTALEYSNTSHNGET